jgi:hypothetical protein
MTPVAIDRTSTVANVRRTTSNESANVGGGGGAEPTENTPRPSVVLNLNTSSNQSALSVLTYGNPRANTAGRSSNAISEPQAQSVIPQRTQAEETTSDAQTEEVAESTQLNDNNTERVADAQDALRLQTDRRNLQAAQATSTSRQAAVADQSA